MVYYVLADKGKLREIVGRKVSDLSPEVRDKVAGLPDIGGETR